MNCSYCRKPIGYLRRLRDAEFCSDDHRSKANPNSARALREAEDLYGEEETWPARWTTEKAELSPRTGQPGNATTILAVVAVACLGVALISLPSSGAANSAPRFSTSLDASRGSLFSTIGDALRSKTPATVHEDFRAGLSNWEGLRGSDWSVSHAGVHPGKLRLWKQSSAMRDYDLEFMGEIEKHSLNWVFRAADIQNYYATKLVSNRGGASNAGLVRYLVLQGREVERVELPLPLAMDKNTDYRVRVSIQGSRFLTSVNGQLISSWNDDRLSAGGVGFFSDPGEMASLKWVSISERDSFVGRIVSHFSLFTIPGDIH